MRPTHGSFHLGEWLVEPSLNRISRGETVVQLEPKVIEVLTCLSARAGEVVPKSEIIDTVWRAEFIADNTLTHAIAELRKALGDDAKNPRYIETITKRGYRIVAPVEGDAPAEPTHQPPPGRLVMVFKDRVVPLRTGENVIGRAQDAVLHVDVRRVSRRHARIVVDGDRAILEDLGSKNGTYLAGRRIAGHRELRDGDQITIGTELLVFRVLDDDEATETQQSLGVDA